ncbi:hypothetical protein BDBG_17480 [Blastomyces gilchristii SLH14081]|uniref:Uncharacterized protein n=1 Tax=Blastomyces gilchristii (strain SLH14081) TaxID=559298 RepID=A0A179UVV8_BLAGS|nr:uncharacterized protein BDBG_17480 [Blastomyces gilchristii SLH14081]OAT11278.1 hypothetical protein BDBG_17480 [Blastomyces gilchristii SLH14081]
MFMVAEDRRSRMAENRSVRVRGGRGSAIENGRESERTRSRMERLESVECNGIVYMIDRAQPATNRVFMEITSQISPQLQIRNLPKSRRLMHMARSLHLTIYMAIWPGVVVW